MALRATVATFQALGLRNERGHTQGMPRFVYKVKGREHQSNDNARNRTNFTLLQCAGAVVDASRKALAYGYNNSCKRKTE